MAISLLTEKLVQFLFALVSMHAKFGKYELNARSITLTWSWIFLAEPLKHSLDAEVVESMTQMFREAWLDFPSSRFRSIALDNFDTLELMDRAHRLAQAMDETLPKDFFAAIDVLTRCVELWRTLFKKNGFSPFFWMPHSLFVTRRGLREMKSTDKKVQRLVHATAMHAQAKLTGLFSAEFSMRPWLVQWESETLAFLRACTHSSDKHLRRLASESTRPRLPWSFRLRRFQENPKIQCDILESLLDDAEIYVRKSVANHLNDISKDHPDLAVRLMRRWLKDNATPQRRWIAGHGLRSLIKAGHPSALKVLGYDSLPSRLVVSVRALPLRVTIGGSVTIEVKISSRQPKSQALMVDFGIDFVKAKGTHGEKIFKLKKLVLPSGESTILRKKVSLAQHSTRKHHPGPHGVFVLVNGVRKAFCTFHLVADF